MPVLRILGLVNGQPTEYDGKYVVDYDPKPREDKEGTFIHLIVTDDPAHARQFADPGEALKLWRASWGIRADGKPNAPLTAYHMR